MYVRRQHLPPGIHVHSLNKIRCSAHSDQNKGIGCEILIFQSAGRVSISFFFYQEIKQVKWEAAG